MCGNNDYFLSAEWKTRLDAICDELDRDELYVLDISGDIIIQGFQVFYERSEAYERATLAVRSFYGGILSDSEINEHIQRAHEGIDKHLHIYQHRALSFGDKDGDMTKSKGRI